MTQLKIPDLGGASDVEVIEVLVSEGDSIEVEQALIVLETDKASMEIPAEQAGTIEKLLIKVGDKVNEGDSMVEISGGSSEAPVAEAAPAEPEVSSTQEPEPEAEDESAAEPAGEAESVTVEVPDLGGASDVDVIEILVRVGDTVDAEQGIIVLETDKASMEIPAGKAGTVEELLVKLGDKVSQGDPMVKLLAQSSGSKPAPAAKAPAPESSAKPADKPASDKVSEKPAGTAQSAIATQETPASKIHAGPAVRKLAREFGVDLSQVKPSGPKGRIIKDDVQAFVKERINSPAASGGSGIPPVPKVDFASFGPVTTEPLNNIKRATAKAMTIASLNVPQVTQFDQVDITELEAFRKSQNGKQKDVKFSIVPFVMKAMAQAMKVYPTFNSSLSEDGESLIMKGYIHIGVAVDTPKGLLVPVIRDVDKKSVTEIAQDLAEKAELARTGKLGLNDMRGGCMSLSSLGGVGGTAFTPIVNPPEVAILGLSRAEMKPVWDGSSFVPRLMLPTSLSYDHRVIDGAEAARFSRLLAGYLEDLRELLI